MIKVYKNQLPKSHYKFTDFYYTKLQNRDDLKLHFTKYTKMNMGRSIFPPGGYLG